jgi:tetratricopeptide (TPR) repeat protein
MRSKLALVAMVFLGVGAVSAAPAMAETRKAERAEKQGPGLSKAARATAVTEVSGKAVGIKAYAERTDAVKAGDMAAFLQMVEALPAKERHENPMYAAFLALDRAAAGDTAGARVILQTANKANNTADGESTFFTFLDSWLLALEGKTDAALDLHRKVAEDMPGATGDLSLAALLEATGRPEQAIAVYEAMTPAQIDAPEHDFDPRNLSYGRVQQVVYRHALLLHRLGRVEEAKAVYNKLAAAQPEEAISFAAALESFDTGKYLDDSPVTVRSAFARSLSDVSYALQEQRIIRGILLGEMPDGFDDQRSAFDQVALLINPENDNLRSTVIADLYRHALYDGVAHVARAAPKATAPLQIAAAQAYLQSKREGAARDAIVAALKLTTTNDRLETLYGALQLRTLLGDKTEAIQLVDEVMALSGNQAEAAAAHGLAAETYGQFGETAKSVEQAALARQKDDTHERRMTLVDALGKAGKTDEAISLLRSELLTRPNDPYTLNTFGYFLVTRTDKTADGFKLLFRARSMAERDAYIADSLGWAYFQLGDLKSARRLIEESRREILPHHNWEIENHLGDIYWHQGEKDAARKAWALALENAPPQPEKRLLTEKLANGIAGPPPAVKALPDVSLDEEEVNTQDI